jgi:probable selenium-dependent hydroxylase accessory protein YqeC
VLTLTEALGVRKGSVVALVGGGGKTSTLFRLCEESSREGQRVLATTTVRMKVEELAPMREVLLWDERDPTGETWTSCPRERGGAAGGSWVDQALAGQFSDARVPVTFLGRSVMRDKLIGLPADYLGRLLSRLTWDVAVVEADGSRGRSIKAHRLGEPVLPMCTTMCVIVIGADGLDETVGEEHCHRPEVIRDLLGLDWGDRLSAERVVDLLCHPRGLIAKVPGDMELVLYVNKAPLGGERSSAADLARGILGRCGHRVQRVAVGDNRQGGIVEVHASESPARGE